MLSPKIRKKLLEKILKKASENKQYAAFLDIKLEDVAYKHCKILSEIMDWDTNSVSRFFALPSFKQTQSLSINSENKILIFLEISSIEQLERILVLEVAFEEIFILLQSMK